MMRYTRKAESIEPYLQSIHLVEINTPSFVFSFFLPKCRHFLKVGYILSALTTFIHPYDFISVTGLANL